MTEDRKTTDTTGERGKIWIDLDNTPHVPFFEPIIEELRRRDYAVVITARDAFQVCELADSRKIPYTRIGHHSGKNRLRKAFGLFYRAMQMAPFVMREKPVLGLSHGSRAMNITCNLMGLPTIGIGDYEFTAIPFPMRPTWEVVPDVIPEEALAFAKGKVLKYPGIKEDVYASRLRPDPDILRQLGLTPGNIIITVRPPATEAHYHNPESDVLFDRFMEKAVATPDAQIVMLPRNAKQGTHLLKANPHWFAGKKTIIPPHAVDGMNLVWHSDLVVSGGGTMNREAAALGVPVYSIFRGQTGAVDHFLADHARLIMIHNIFEVDTKIPIVRRSQETLAVITSQPALPRIVEHIENVMASLTTNSHGIPERRIDAVLNSN